MGWCVSLLKVLLYTSATLGVILTYFHIECQREKEAKEGDRFNDVYLPDKTDIEANLPFIKREQRVMSFPQVLSSSSLSSVRVP